METFSVLLPLYNRNLQPLVGLPHKTPAMWTFEAFEHPIKLLVMVTGEDSVI